MKIESLRVYVDRLRNGYVEQIEGEFPSELLEAADLGAHLRGNIIVSGEAYLAEDHLVLRLDIQGKAIVPCSVCNNDVEIEINILNSYNAEDIEHPRRSSVFDAAPLVRELILLELPAFAECNDGKCPSRKDLASYLDKEAKNKKNGPEKGFHPFSDLTKFTKS